MAFRYSPRVINDGLVFCVDAKNPKSIYQTNIKGVEIDGGTNKYLGTPITADFNKTNSDNFSFGGWFFFRSNLAASQLIIGKWGTNTNSTGGYDINNNSSGQSIRGSLANGGASVAHTAGHAFSLNTWMFLVFTYETGVGMKVYKDDNGSNDSAYTGAFNDTPTVFRIGKADYSSSAFDGFADECFFYNKTLTPGQIDTLYNTGKGYTYDTLPDFDSLVSWWSLKDDGIDIHGGNDFTALGGPTFNQSGIRFTPLNILDKSQEGVALNGPTLTDGTFTFDGVNDYINFGKVFNLFEKDFSVDIWIKLDPTFSGTPWLFFFSQLVTVNEFNPNYVVLLSLTAITLSVNGTGQGSQSYAFETGRWYNITSTFRDSNKQNIIYIDGDVIWDKITSIRPGSYSNSEFMLSRPTSPWDGNISSTKIYNKVLTQEEISQNYNTLKGRFGL